MRLVIPAPMYLPSYRAALEAGWSPDHVLGNLATQRELDRLDRDAIAFLMSLDDPKAKGPPLTLRDGTLVPRIPAYRRWMWDGAFCGSISLQWQNGTPDLPPYLSSHISFGVVPWKRGLGYASAALNAITLEARGRGLPFVQMTIDAENIAAKRTVERAGAVLATEPAHADGAELVYRIAL